MRQSKKLMEVLSKITELHNLRYADSNRSMCEQDYGTFKYLEKRYIQEIQRQTKNLSKTDKLRLEFILFNQRLNSQGR